MPRALFEPRDVDEEAYFQRLSEIELWRLERLSQEIEPPVGFRDILRYVERGRSNPRVERALFLEPERRADFKALVSARAVVEMPVRAAAASESRGERRFAHGVTIEIAETGDDDTAVLLLICFEDPTLTPERMIVFDESLRHHSVALPAASEGRMQIVLDRSDPRDAFLIDSIIELEGSVYFL